ncbi:hypothetical protein CPB84DRAFT_763602 [Gymnopilus junonius]|uniref:Uncharacterized protein n=1 Tax=Gymnopilus junonius TaxID=109634 RepID=A0A9P5P1N7_GYMJU|nr:hypothetical protein CPB84DRAFT_763602 [Gymnopilus junonius]
MCGVRAGLAPLFQRLALARPMIADGSKNYHLLSVLVSRTTATTHSLHPTTVKVEQTSVTYVIPSLNLVNRGRRYRGGQREGKRKCDAGKPRRLRYQLCTPRYQLGPYHLGYVSHHTIYATLSRGTLTR